MNREQRRMEMKRKKAIGRELVRLEKPEQYHQGYMDGGKAMTEACYAAFTAVMSDFGLLSSEILEILQNLDEKLVLYSGDGELQQEAYDKAGILVDFSQVFSQDRIQKKEAG